MERLDESIVWGQYATYVATDGSFLPSSQAQLFSEASRARNDDSSEALGNRYNNSSCCY